MTTTEEARTPGQESAHDPVAILYTNYRGETAVRRIVPGSDDLGCEALWFGKTEWHPQVQWMLSAWDEDKGAYRDFAVADIKAWGQAAVDAALAEPQAAPLEWNCNGDPEQPSPAAPGRPIAAAPVNEEVFVYCGEMRFRAKLVPGASMTMDEEPCDQWQATIEGEHPPCWSDGCCWANNEDENTSLQPTHWSPIAPAPSSPGVPDSVRALSEAADYAAERYVESVDAEGLSDRERYRLNIQARAARRQFEDACTDFVRTLIASHPAGQSTGQGIGWAEVVKAICSAVCRVEGLDPDELRQEYESEAHGWRDTDPQWTRYAEAVAEVLDALPLPSPDSARTGQVGTGWVLVPAEPTQAMWAAFRNADAGSIAFTKAYHAMIAARPAAPEAQGTEISQAAQDVLAERRRQVEDERFTHYRDDGYVHRELARAAACYALQAGQPERFGPDDVPYGFPWPSVWWKPDTPRRNLVKSAALAIAEIERIDRAAPPSSSGQEST